MAWTDAARRAAAMTRRIHTKAPKELAAYFKSNRNMGMGRKDSLRKAAIETKLLLVRQASAAKRK